MQKKGGRIENLNIFCAPEPVRHLAFILLSYRLRLFVSSFSSSKQMLEQYNKKAKTASFPMRFNS